MEHLPLNLIGSAARFYVPTSDVPDKIYEGRTGTHQDMILYKSRSSGRDIRHSGNTADQSCGRPFHKEWQNVANVYGEALHYLT